MSLMNAMNVNASGMSAQRLRMDVISSNIANVNTTRDENGEVYRRKMVIFQEKNADSFDSILQGKRNNTGLRGVKVTEIAEDFETPLTMVYDPSHPDADDEGYVAKPNINTVTEMTNLISATRAYEANVTAFNATKSMAMKALEIGR